MSIVKSSRRYEPFVYWWDVSDTSKEKIKKDGTLLLVQKDTLLRATIKAADLLPLLTEARRTSRSQRQSKTGKGNWGLKVRRARPNEIEVESGEKDKPAFIRVKWCKASRDRGRRSER